VIMQGRCERHRGRWRRGSAILGDAICRGRRRPHRGPILRRVACELSWVRVRRSRSASRSRGAAASGSRDRRGRARMRSRPAGGAWVLDGAGKAYTIRNGSCGDSVTAGRRCATRFVRRCASGSSARRQRGERPYAADGLTARKSSLPNARSCPLCVLPCDANRLSSEGSTRHQPAKS
jgi:hypothetical protein